MKSKTSRPTLSALRYMAKRTETTYSKEFYNKVLGFECLRRLDGYIPDGISIQTLSGFYGSRVAVEGSRCHVLVASVALKVYRTEIKSLTYGQFAGQSGRGVCSIRDFGCKGFTYKPFPLSFPFDPPALGAIIPQP